MDIPGLEDTQTVGDSKKNKNMQDKHIVKSLQHLERH